MQPHVCKGQAQQLERESPFDLRSEQFCPACLQQVSVFNSRRADRLASTATETSIDVEFKRSRVGREFAFLDRAHQVNAAARTVILVAGQRVRRTSFEA